MLNKKAKKICAALACVLAAGATFSLAACDEGGEKFTVTFDSRGGSVVASVSVAEGSSISRPASPTKEFYVFDDWYSDFECTVPFDFDSFKMPAENIVVYAGWTDPEVSSMITFDANGGTFADGAKSIYTVGEVGSEFSAPEEAPSFTGYLFGGWYEDPECNNLLGINAFPTHDTTVYAKWNKDPNYAYVEYYGNGELVATVPVKRGETTAAPDVFEGDITAVWYTDEKLTNEYSFSSAVNVNFKLYASCYSTGLEIADGVVVDYNGYGGAIVIPDKFDGVPVTEIGESAFYSATGIYSITSVSLPATVTTIAANAFYNCTYLSQIDLSNVVTIGDGAFENCSRLKTFGSLAKATSIGKLAFADCAKLGTVELPAALSEIGEGAFIGCTSLKEIVIPSAIESLSGGMFYGCTSLASVTVSAKDLTSLAVDAFDGCRSLASVTILSSTLPQELGADGVSPFVDLDVTVYVPASLLEAYKSNFGDYDNGALEAKFAALEE